MISSLRIAIIASIVCIVALSFYRNLYHSAKQRADEADKIISSLNLTIEQLKSQQEQVSDIDKKYTSELNKANEEIENLRSDLSNNTKRLLIKASCKRLPSSTTSSLDNAARAELDRDAEQNYLRLRQQLIQMQKQLEALQEYLIKTNSF